MSAGELLSFTEMKPPTPPGSRFPHLEPTSNGIILSWTEPRHDSLFALVFSRHVKDGWMPPLLVASGSDWFVNWADFPTMVQLEEGTLAAHYLEKSGPETYAYDVRLTWSTDGGHTWSDAITPHEDGTPTEHGFVSLLAAGPDRLRAVWLDGRYTGGHGHDPDRAMTLRTATLTTDGILDEQAELDARVCDCCQTDAAHTSDGLVVAYRDRSATSPEIRDLSVVRIADGSWTAPHRVHADGWALSGCPVNGPAVAANGDLVAVAWFTGAQDAPAVRLAFSRDGGATFGPPIAIDDGTPIGRVDVALLPTGAALVSWIERADEEAEIRVRRIGGDGVRGPSQTVAATSPRRASGFPRMAVHDETLYLAWTDVTDSPRLRVVAAPLDE